MKSFDIRTKIFFGDHAMDRLVDIPYKKVLIITDPYVVQSGMIGFITSRLAQGNKEFEIFKEVVPDPPIEKIAVGDAASVYY